MVALMPIDVGAEAPDFTLKDQNNQEVALSSFSFESICAVTTTSASWSIGCRPRS